MTLELPHRLPLDIQQDDIHKGEQGSCSHCPVARAAIRAVVARIGGIADPVDLVREAMPYNVLVGSGGFSVHDGLVRIANYALPPEAVAFVDAFDHARNRNAATAAARPFRCEALRIGGAS